MPEYPMKKIIDDYYKVREKRLPKIQKFWNNDDVPFLVIQRIPSKIWKGCNTVDALYKENMATFVKELEITTDHIPYLEPWFGVGVFANAYGSEYYWREGEAPATHVVYHKFEEIKTRKKKNIEDSEVMNMVLDAIRYFKEKTFGQLPISLTDTQSAFDTATLIFDATQFFMSCYDHPEEIKEYLSEINQFIIDFSKRQMELIGEMIAKPGHIMLSDTTLNGISISDDNLALCSQEINKEFSLSVNQELADVFGGLALHSCGRFESTMKLIAKEMRNVVMIECALSNRCDPTPNRPELVRDALKGSSIILSARVGNNLTEIDSTLEKLYDPSLRLIIWVGYDEDDTINDVNYHHVVEKLYSLYG